MLFNSNIPISPYWCRVTAYPTVSDSNPKYVRWMTSVVGFRPPVNLHVEVTLLLAPPLATEAYLITNMAGGSLYRASAGRAVFFRDVISSDSSFFRLDFAVKTEELSVLTAEDLLSFDHEAMLKDPVVSKIIDELMAMPPAWDVITSPARSAAEKRAVFEYHGVSGI